MARKNKPVATKLDLSRKKTIEFDVDTNIKVAYKTGKILYGKNQILKNLFRENPFKMLIMSNNCPSELMTQINHINSLLKDKLFIYKYKGSSWDLGLACAKPYMISVMGIIDFGDSDLISLRTK
ncbi:MAG: 50S ribosomal protein L30e [Candidatus Lokiarchaeota archaeon]|nr:50S ribosomal protein L30e [Candidatus Lokiarchaeota archaeon]